MHLTPRRQFNWDVSSTLVFGEKFWKNWLTTELELPAQRRFPSTADDLGLDFGKLVRVKSFNFTLGRCTVVQISSTLRQCCNFLPKSLYKQNLGVLMVWNDSSTYWRENITPVWRTVVFKTFSLHFHQGKWYSTATKGYNWRT